MAKDRPRPASRRRRRLRARSSRRDIEPAGQPRRAGGLFVGHPLQVAEHHGRTVFLRQAVELVVEHPAQLATGDLGQRVGLPVLGFWNRRDAIRRAGGGKDRHRHLVTLPARNTRTGIQ